MVPGLFRAGVVNSAVRPTPIHVAIVSVGNPGALMIGVAVDSAVSGIGNRDMTKKKNTLHVVRICEVGVFNERFDLRRSGAPGYIVANDGPAIADQILLQSGKLGGECRCVRVID